MSLLDNSRHSITVLKSHELLHIFGYLDYQDLLQCRLVCPSWYQLIKNDSGLMDKFRCKLNFNAGTWVSSEEPVISLLQKSNIKLNSIIIEEDFLDVGNSIAVVDANRSKMSALSTILTDLNAMETVTEMIVHARDNEPRTSEVLLRMIMAMKNLKILRFTLTAFVHMIESMHYEREFTEFTECTSLVHVQILHTDCKRLIEQDFEGLLTIFPNIKRIDVSPSDAMLLDERILERFAKHIKSIEKLESYTLTELAEIRKLSLSHISYECDADNAEDVTLLREFLTAHPEIETMCLKLLNGSRKFFNQTLNQIIDLDLTIKTSAPSQQIDHCLKLGNILKWTPEIKKLAVKYKGGIEHQFGHKVIEMKNLVDVSMTRFSLDCDICCTTILKSMAHVKSLKLAPRHSDVSLQHLNLIAISLEQLECLELRFDDVSK